MRRRLTATLVNGRRRGAAGRHQTVNVAYDWVITTRLRLAKTECDSPAGHVTGHVGRH